MKESTSTLLSNLTSVLPDNRSPIESSLEFSFNKEILAIETPFPHLLFAQQTPLNLVPFLAAEKQLPVWDDNDTEKVKRDTTKTAWLIRKKSGTPAGIKLAFESLDFDCSMTPWHQQTPLGEPYSFEVWAYARDTKITAEISIKMDELLQEIKSERDTYSLFLARGSNSNYFIGAALEIGTTITSEPYQSTGCISEASPFGASCNHTREIVTTEPAIQ